jgi:hypothetical protein
MTVLAHWLDDFCHEVVRGYGHMSESDQAAQREKWRARAERLYATATQGAVEAAWALNDAVIDELRAEGPVRIGRLWEAVEVWQAAAPERGQ